MKDFEEFLLTIEDNDKREFLKEILQFVIEKYPNLKTRIAWNQPMFTYNDTFIISFSPYKNHLGVVPEKRTIEIFKEEINLKGYECTTMMFKLPWGKEIDYDLISKIIEFNVEDKKNAKTFWRK